MMRWGRYWGPECSWTPSSADGLLHNHVLWASVLPFMKWGLLHSSARTFLRLRASMHFHQLVLMVKQQNLRWNVKWSQKQSTIWKRRWILFQLRIKQNHFPFYSSQPGCLLLATPQPHCSAPRLIVPFSWPEQSVTVEALVFLHQKYLQRATACICVSLQNKKML